jgi:hypothetical protein
MTAEKLYGLLTKAGVQFDVIEVFEGLRVINVMVEEEDEDDTDTWLAKHRDRVDAFYAKGLDFKPDPGCSMCDVHNDYICFQHEIEQLRESEFEKEIKLRDEDGNYMGMMGGHEVRK